MVVTASDRSRLEALVVARGSQQKHVWRARIILLAADGLGTVGVTVATGKSKTYVWLARTIHGGRVDCLLRDKPGLSASHGSTALVDDVVALTLEPAAHETRHWTVRAIAKAVGIAAFSVVKFWHDHGPAPHRLRGFKLSNDSALPRSCRTWSPSTSRRQRT